MDLDDAQKRKLLIAFVLFDLLVVAAIAIWFLVFNDPAPADDGGGETGRRAPHSTERAVESGRSANRTSPDPSTAPPADDDRPRIDPDVVPLVVECVDGRSGIAVAARSMTLRIGRTTTKPLVADGRGFRLDDSPYRHGKRADARLALDAGPGLAAFNADLDATVGRVSPDAREVRMIVPLWPRALVEGTEFGIRAELQVPPDSSIGLGGGVAGPEPPKGTCSLDVLAFDTDGRPVPRVVIELSDGPKRWSEVTDEAGLAQFDGLFAGQIAVRGVGAEFRPVTARTTLKPSERGRVELREGPGRMGLVRVVDREGRAVAAASVEVLSRGAWVYTHVVDGVQFVVARTDARGELRLGPLPPRVSLLAVAAADSNAADLAEDGETVIRLMTRR